MQLSFNINKKIDNLNNKYINIYDTKKEQRKEYVY